MSVCDRMDMNLPGLFMPGMIVISLSGHDRGRLYVIIEEKSGNRLILSDGDKRKLTNAKQKNTKHVRSLGQAISPEELTDALHQETCERERDIFIRKLIRQWVKTEPIKTQKDMPSEE